MVRTLTSCRIGTSGKLCSGYDFLCGPSRNGWDLVHETVLRYDATPPPGVNVDPNGPNLFTALEEQLGLKLQPKKMQVPVLVIEHIEPLIEN